MATLVELSPEVCVVAVTPSAKTEVADNEPVIPVTSSCVTVSPKFTTSVPNVIDSFAN